MVFCPKCGEIIPPTTRKCLRCGIGIDQGVVAGHGDEVEQPKKPVRAPIVTGRQEPAGGLRQVEPSSNQWDTFQTAYQKERGIDHQQSMQEIDDFVGKGGEERSATGTGSVEDREEVEVSQGTKDINSMLARNGVTKKGAPMLGSAHVFNKSGVDPNQVRLGKGGGGEGPVKSQTTTTETETRYEMEGHTKDGLVGADEGSTRKFGAPATTSAADFFSQVKEKEAAKYRPQKDGKYR